MATFEVVGVYPVEVTRTSMSAAMKYHGRMEALDKEGNLLEDEWEVVVQRDLHGLALIELSIAGAYSADELSEINHGSERKPRDNQAPYMEFYLDGDGLHLIAESEAIECDYRRVCFFLHFVDTNQPLYVGFDRRFRKQIRLPSQSPMPNRLKPYAHYLYVD